MVSRDFSPPMDLAGTVPRLKFFEGDQSISQPIDKADLREIKILGTPSKVL
jgi:hypothetical protein